MYFILIKARALPTLEGNNNKCKTQIDAAYRLIAA